MNMEPLAKRHCVVSITSASESVECRQVAFERVKLAAGLGECIAYEITIQGWGKTNDGEAEEFHSNVVSPSSIDFGHGRIFQVRMARYGTTALEKAEDKGDFDMAPLEFQLVMKRINQDVESAADLHNFPPHFKLFGYECVASCRAASGSFVELLDTANEGRIRDADYQEGATTQTLALAFTLPGRGAGCEDVGVSHELLHEHVDALKQSERQLHLMLVVPLPERQIVGSFADGNSITIVAAGGDSDEDDRDGDEESK